MKKNQLAPVCSVWENKYFYCTFSKGDSIVIRFPSDPEQAPVLCVAADASVTNPENKRITYSEFMKAYERYAKYWNDKHAVAFAKAGKYANKI